MMPEGTQLTCRSSSFRVGTEGAEVSSGVGVGVEKVFRGNLVTRLSSSLCPWIVAVGVGAGTRTVATGTASGDGDTTRAPASTVAFHFLYRQGDWRQPDFDIICISNSRPDIACQCFHVCVE